MNYTDTEEPIIVFPEGDEPRIREAAKRLTDLGVNCLLLTDSSVPTPEGEPYDTLMYKYGGFKNGLARGYYDRRQHKGVSLSDANKAILDPNVFGTMLVLNGMADGMVSGAIHSTADTILPALQLAATGFASSCMIIENMVFADCGLNVNPSPEQLAYIAIQSAETAKLLGLVPNIAMLSYSTGDSGNGEAVEKVRRATHIVAVSRPDLAIRGPIQFDAAFNPEIARQKGDTTDVKANVYVFPSLEAGNIAYKAVQQFTGCRVIGPILQGLSVAVNDLSRGCTVDDIVGTALFTVTQSRHLNKDVL